MNKEIDLYFSVVNKEKEMNCNNKVCKGRGARQYNAIGTISQNYLFIYLLFDTRCHQICIMTLFGLYVAFNFPHTSYSIPSSFQKPSF